MCDIERFDAHAIAGEHQAARGFCPQSDREHAAQAGETLRVPFEKRVQHGFGVGMRNETMTKRFQLGAQFQVIVNFAVEDDHGIAILREDWLVAAFQVNNFQARGAQGANFGSEDALLVRAAMNERRRGAPDAVWIGRPIFMCKTSNTAQIPIPLSVWVPSIVTTV